jgi:hypothetical protein
MLLHVLIWVSVFSRGANDSLPNSLGATVYSVNVKSKSVLTSLVVDEQSEEYRRLLPCNRMWDLETELSRFLPPDTPFCRSWFAGTAFAWRSGGNCVDVFAVPGERGVNALKSATSLNMTPLGGSQSLFQLGDGGIIVKPSEQSTAMVSLWDGFVGSLKDCESFLQQHIWDFENTNCEADLMLRIYPKHLVPKSTAKVTERVIEHWMQRRDRESFELHERRCEGSRLFLWILSRVQEVEEIRVTQSEMIGGKCRLELRVRAKANSEVARILSELRQSTDLRKVLIPTDASVFCAFSLPIMASKEKSGRAKEDPLIGVCPVVLIRFDNVKMKPEWWAQIPSPTEPVTFQMPNSSVGERLISSKGMTATYFSNPTSLLWSRQDGPSTEALSITAEANFPPIGVEVELAEDTWLFARIHSRSFIGRETGAENFARDSEAAVDVIGTISDNEVLVSTELDESQLEIVYVTFESVWNLAESICQMSNLPEKP